MKYDFIIVLCPSVRCLDGKFSQFENGKYLGGQTRMEAAVKLAQENKNTTFILVGGYNEDDGIKASKYYKKSQKTADVEKYLKEKKVKEKKVKNKKIIKRIEIVNSLPCTKHNLVAVFHEFKEELSDKNKKIGLLTNAYHLPRALRFWKKLVDDEKDEFGTIIKPGKKPSKDEPGELKPIVAESIVGVEKDSRYAGEHEYISRLEDELSGLIDIEKDEYRDGCILAKKKLRFYKQIIEDHFDKKTGKNDLLTSGDQEKAKKELKKLEE
jgi:hypothetical protein